MASRKKVHDEVVQIGNYRILKTIGKGSFAEVKLAQHVTTNVEVGFFCFTIVYEVFHDTYVQFCLIVFVLIIFCWI